jgi:hypothetical protein
MAAAFIPRTALLLSPLALLHDAATLATEPVNLAAASECRKCLSLAVSHKGGVLVIRNKDAVLSVAPAR